MEHKEEIKQTRLAGLGSSDAKMVASVGRIGQLNETARKRIAEMLGLKEKDDVSTAAMEKGNELEAIIYDIIKSKAAQAVSNPFYKSQILSDTFGIGIFNHIDVEIETDRQIVWYEVKSTIKSADETMEDYLHQLAWHWMLLKEKSEQIRKQPTLFFTHYNTSSGEDVFNAENLTQIKVDYDQIRHLVAEIADGLTIIMSELETFEYAPEIKSDGENLPAETKAILPKINNLLRMAKEAEEQADKFKQQLKEAMEQAGIKSIDNDYFKATYVPEGVQARFDSKSFQSAEPETYKKFLKNSTVKSQLRLTLK